jgi:rRNA-processing protein FCF1
MVLKVIIDTNFLLIPSTLNVDVFEGIVSAANDSVELITLNLVVEELEILIASKELNLKDREAAKLALALLKQKNLKIEHCSNEHTDDAILKKALEFKQEGYSAAIATQDKELISRALSSKIQIFTLRQKKKILLLK